MKTARITEAARTRCYGPPGDTSALVRVETPWNITVAVHYLIADVYLDACRDAAKCEWNPKRIDSFANRTVRGSTTRSLHAWGLACDYFITGPGVPPPGGVYHPLDAVPADFAACFEALGFTWGAKFSGRTDEPHIEWAGAPPPLVPTVPKEDDEMSAEQTELLRAIATEVGTLRAAVDVIEARGVRQGLDLGTLKQKAEAGEYLLGVLNERTDRMESTLNNMGAEPT